MHAGGVLWRQRSSGTDVFIKPREAVVNAPTIDVTTCQATVVVVSDRVASPSCAVASKATGPQSVTSAPPQSNCTERSEPRLARSKCERRGRTRHIPVAGE